MYKLYTIVDITQTNVKIKDASIVDWELKRNQQRNFDSLIQTISLRAQPLIKNQYIITPKYFQEESINLPYYIPEFSKCWVLEFEIEHADAFGSNCNFLLDDLNHVPIILGLSETYSSFSPLFVSRGEFKNVSIIF